MFNYIFRYVFIYLHIYIWRRAGYVQQKYLPLFNGVRGKLPANRRQTGGSSSGSSSGVPTGPVGGAPTRPARRAADWAGRGAAAATAAAAACLPSVCRLFAGSFPRTPLKKLF